MEADPLADPDDERHLEFVLGHLVASAASLPQQGDQVLGFGGEICSAGNGYGRVETPEGELLFEGGDPACGAGASWSPRLAARPAAEADACEIFSCLSEAWEVTLTIDGLEQVLPIGAPVEVELAGRPYLAEAQFARRETSCDLVDGGGVKASAYLAALAE